MTIVSEKPAYEKATDYSEEVGLDEIREIEKRSYDIIEGLRSKVFAPNMEKELNVRFSISEVAEMVDRTTTAIRDAEKAGRLPKPQMDAKGRRAGYTLKEVNHMRKVFGTLPWRAETDEPVVIAVQNFKGGCGKSTTTSHLSQYFALQGYRVCVIDCDPQGSTTTIFGINPDYDLEEEDTLYPFLMHGGQSTLDYALRPTYWDGLSIIPANLSLYNAEYLLAAKVQNDSRMFDRLSTGIDSIKDQFDIILIDPPPALGMISLSVLRAANSLIVPVPASIVDFSSTAHFFTMLADALESLERHGMPTTYKFMKVLASKVNEGKSAQKAIVKTMRNIYQNCMLETALKDSAEIDNASARLMTVYELPGPITSRDVHNRCKAYLNSVNKEVELLVRKTWRSHHASLRKQGLI